MAENTDIRKLQTSDGWIQVEQSKCATEHVKIRSVKQANNIVFGPI